MRVRAAGGVAVVIVAVACLVGCSASDSPDQSIESLSLTGPWASDFQVAHANAKSDYERGVLKDGEITSAEYEESKNHLRSCLGDAGYTITWDQRGGFELGSKSGKYPDDFFERSDPVLQHCESKWVGSILYLYEQIRRNPEKKDESALQVACLRSAGLIDEMYTKDQWRRDNEKGIFPFDARSDAAVSCELDPLGLWYSG